MFTCVFSSPILKFKNDKIYLLTTKNDINCDEYENETYYIKLDEIQKSNKFSMSSNLINYDIITNRPNENLVIQMNFDNELTDDEMIKMMHAVGYHISGLEVNTDIYNNVNSDIINEYTNKYIRL